MNLGEVAWVADKVRKLLSHLLLGQLVETVELSPELIFDWHSSLLRELDVTEIKGIENTLSGLVSLVTFEMGERAVLGKDEKSERWGVSHADELSESGSIRLRDGTGLDSLSKTELEGVLTVVLPDTLEVRLVWETGRHLVREDHIFLLDDLWSELAKSLILSLESFLAFRGASIKTEHNVLVLVSVSERVEHALSLIFVIVGKNVTLVASPVHLGDFVVEKTSAISTPDVLNTEPGERVWLDTLTSKGLRSPLSLKIMQSILPSLTRVHIDIPAVHVLVLGPIWNSESLEDGTGTSVERHISDALKKGVWMEVLSVDVVHDIRFLVELVEVDVLNAQTYIIIKQIKYWRTRHKRQRVKIKCAENCRIYA